MSTKDDVSDGGGFDRGHHWEKLPMELVMRQVGAMLRAAEAIGGIQMKATHGARELFERVEDQMESTRVPLNVASLQSELTQRETADVAHYWQSMFEVLVRLQADMFSATQALVDMHTEEATSEPEPAPKQARARRRGAPSGKKP